MSDEPWRNRTSDVRIKEAVDVNFWKVSPFRRFQIKPLAPSCLNLWKRVDVGGTSRLQIPLQLVQTFVSRPAPSLNVLFRCADLPASSLKDEDEGQYFPIDASQSHECSSRSKLASHWEPRKTAFLSCLFFDFEVDVDFRFGPRRRYPDVLKLDLFEKPKLTQPRQREGQK